MRYTQHNTGREEEDSGENATRSKQADFILRFTHTRGPIRIHNVHIRYMGNVIERHSSSQMINEKKKNPRDNGCRSRGNVVRVAMIRVDAAYYIPPHNRAGFATAQLI